jgi:hypothetical protein
VCVTCHIIIIRIVTAAKMTSSSFSSPGLHTLVTSHKKFNSLAFPLRLAAAQAAAAATAATATAVAAGVVLPYVLD